MKSFLLVALGLLITAFVQAQQINPLLKQQFEDYFQKQKSPLLPKTDLKTLVPNLGLESWAQLKPGVYALPQDGMPCVVPDTNDIVAIPNAFTKQPTEILGKIPNVTPQTGEELRRNFKRLYAPPGR